MVVLRVRETQKGFRPVGRVGVLPTKLIVLHSDFQSCQPHCFAKRAICKVFVWGGAACQRCRTLNPKQKRFPKYHSGLADVIENYSLQAVCKDCLHCWDCHVYRYETFENLHEAFRQERLSLERTKRKEREGLKDAMRELFGK